MALLAWLDARDRACGTWLSAAARRPLALRAWRALTHLGGATAATLLLLALLAVEGTRGAGRAGAAIVLLSHAAVQLVKRTVGRPRPATVEGCVARVGEPDRFSFPSGHAAAGMSLALALLPLVGTGWGAALVALAAMVGLSRVVLGVHYLGDVVVGQALAAAAAVAVGTL